MKISKIVLCALIGFHTALAVETSLTGQIRERTLASDLLSTENSQATVQHELRSRLGLKITAPDQLSGLIEFQDSRRFGSEPEAIKNVVQSRTLGNAANLDLHQAYIQWGDENLHAKLGRQKVAWGSQRLLSSLEWHPQARSFDAITLQHKCDVGHFQGIAALIADTSTSIRGDEAWIAGARFSRKISDSLQFEAYGLYDQSRLATMGLANWDLQYYGGRLSYDKNIVAEAEFIWQTGEVSKLNSQAWQLASRLGYRLPKASILLGYDAMSGDDNAQDNSFQTYLNPYSFGHQYFGWMDYIVSNKADTKGRGIQDLRLDLEYKTSIAKLQFSAHHFLTQAQATGLGQELDIQATFASKSGLNIPIGAGLFVPSDSGALLPKLGGSKHITWQFYLMPTFTF